MKVSIIVPCYEEEKIIKEFYQAVSLELDKTYLDYELVFINDGSKDRTLKILKTLAKEDNKIRYVSFSRNFGKEAAILAGLTFARGDAVILMDADLQHPPYLIPQLIQGYKDGFDQIIAKRNRNGDSFCRTVISRFYYRIMNYFIEVELVDGIGDFRLLSRRAVNTLLRLEESNRFSKGLFCWIGFKEKVIEYENVVRNDGESKWSFSRLLNYGIDGIISFNIQPLRASIYLGMSVTTLAAIYVLLCFLKSIIFGIDVPGYFTIIASILLIGGIQLLFLGVIGEYIGRIYCETKRRPHFIVEEDNVGIAELGVVNGDN